MHACATPSPLFHAHHQLAPPAPTNAPSVGQCYLGGGLRPPGFEDWACATARTRTPAPLPAYAHTNTRYTNSPHTPHLTRGRHHLESVFPATHAVPATSTLLPSIPAPTLRLNIHILRISSLFCPWAQPLCQARSAPRPGPPARRCVRPARRWGAREGPCGCAAPSRAPCGAAARPPALIGPSRCSPFPPLCHGPPQPQAQGHLTAYRAPVCWAGGGPPGPPARSPPSAQPTLVPPPTPLAAAHPAPPPCILHWSHAPGAAWAKCDLLEQPPSEGRRGGKTEQRAGGLARGPRPAPASPRAPPAPAARRGAFTRAFQRAPCL
ncbi:MAG: hypothetical protein J3K34DRAFT_416923 [Monoraphidium minutum]|nr:MAG: hypothetical protein J3K34DRAFT_416923 [Monoraphidium minutum]